MAVPSAPPRVMAYRPTPAGWLPRRTDRHEVLARVDLVLAAIDDTIGDGATKWER